MRNNSKHEEATGYRFTGGRGGVFTKVDVSVRGCEFVTTDAGRFVDARMVLGASEEPITVRFTLRQALEADIIERAE